MRAPTRLAAAVALALAAVSLTALPAHAAAAAKTYANCTAINKVYSGGIAKKGVKVNRTPSGNRPLKGTVKYSDDLYNANKKSDRDGDKVACEKS